MLARCSIVTFASALLDGHFPASFFFSPVGQSFHGPKSFQIAAWVLDDSWYYVYVCIYIYLFMYMYVYV